MSDDDLLDDLLLRWEELHDQGEDVTAEELCRERPGLAGRLTERIEALKAVAWVREPVEDEPDPVLAVPEPPAPPRTLAGRYRLDGLLGEGGFSQVWKAFDLELQRTVAVKVPKASRPLTPGEVERFLAEARRVAQLRHPGVVAVHDIYRSGAGYFFVTDWIDGCDLASRLRQGRLPQGEAVRLVAGVARILAYAHGRGFVHLDIKPHNILLDDKGHPLVCDFGIAATEQELLRGEGVKATLAYASPEQAGGGQIDARSDIWSLGVVLYEMLAGRLPFDAPGPVALREQIISADPPALRTADATVPPALERACLKSLAKNPAHRFASAQELADELTALLRPPKAGYKLPALLLGLVVAFVAAALAVAYRPRTPPIAEPAATRTEDDELPATEALRSFDGHAGPVSCIAFSPDGQAVASGAADATVRIRPVGGGKGGVVLKQVTGCTALAYTTDGKTLACGCENGTVRLWDVSGTSPKEGLVLPGHAGRVSCVTFSPGGNFLVTGGKDGTVRILDRRATKPRAALIPKTGGPVLWTGFSADGKLLVGYGDSPAGPGMFWVWELATKDGNPRLALSQKAPLAGLHDLRSLRISSAGTLVLAAAGSQVYVWRKEQGKDSFRVTGSFPRPASCVALSPGERLALSCGRDGLRLWDVETLREKVRLVGHAGAVEAVAFSPGGDLAASGGADGTVRLWRMGEKTALAEPPQLRRLNLDYTPTGDEALRRLTGPDLGELRLTGTKITDDGLACLRDCGRLRFLDLGQTGITGEGLKHLDGLTGLRHLGLSGTRVTDGDLAQLRGFENLRHLNLDHTQITDAGLGHLAALASLTDLRLTRTQVTDAGMRTLAGLKGLRRLHLYHTQVTDAGLEALDGLPDLEDIGLAGTRVTEAGFLRCRKARR